MTHQAYLRLKNALIQRKREVANSKEAADRIIDELGIRDLIIPINSEDKKRQLP
ncbi:hypothetical protein [Chitinophaga pinensis]|uniref:hypothetical protein n=1 Tax=Chitinophaga pinensis TaxID=79329 RepID=UPI0016486BCF|nr:hypothetical protein [Chitinophaga pinensis]